jgi:hypothetical protein
LEWRYVKLQLVKFFIVTVSLANQRENKMIRMAKYLVTFAAVALLSSPAFAQIDYFEDFEGLNAGDPNALTDAGWLIFANVWNDYPGCDTTYTYGYGVFGAPNGGPGFSSIADGNSGQALNAYSDYNNGDHANGLCIETSLFQERALTEADAGTYEFLFNTQAAYDENGRVILQPPVDTFGFVKLLDPDNGFALVYVDDVSTLTTGAKSLTITLDEAAAGLLLQWGFSTRASNYEPTGRWYDNVSFAPEGTYEPPAGPVGDNFEGIPIPGWALFIMAGMLAYLGATQLRSRRKI